MFSLERRTLDLVQNVSNLKDEVNAQLVEINTCKNQINTSKQQSIQIREDIKVRPFIFMIEFYESNFESLPVNQFTPVFCIEVGQISGPS